LSPNLFPVPIGNVLACSPSQLAFVPGTPVWALCLVCAVRFLGLCESLWPREKRILAPCNLANAAEGYVTGRGVVMYDRPLGRHREHISAGPPRGPQLEARRLAELEETVRRYGELKLAMTDMMFVVDGAGLFLDANERLAARLGFTIAELSQMKLYELVEDDAEDPRQKMMPFFARSGGPRSLLTKAGERVRVFVSSVGRYDEAGQFSGAVVVCREAGTGEERTETIAGTALEMNQPLAGIYGYSELLRTTVGAREPAQRYVKQIYEQSERLARLVRRIRAQQGMPPGGIELDVQAEEEKESGP